MDEIKSKDYQTYILFFSWTVGLIATIVRLFVEIEDPVKFVLFIMLLDIFLNLGSKHKRFNEYAVRVLILIFIFYGWLLFSISYSPSRSYKYDKALYFVANIIFFIYPLYIKKINFNLLIKLYCIIVLPLSVYFVYMNSIVWQVNSASTALFMTIRDTYLMYGLHLGILSLLLIYFKKNILLLITTLSLLVATGARGPLIFTLLLIVLYLFWSKIKLLKPANILKSIFALFGIAVAYILNADKIDNLLGNTFRRFGSLLGGADASALERVYRLKFAFYEPFEKISTFLFGNGIGSFGLLYEQIDRRSYPHNILIESFFELGMVGLTVFLLIFISIFRKISIKDNVFGLLFLFVFLNAMKSSNITDLWILFSLMGMLVSLYKSEPKTYNITQLQTTEIQ